ncbi:MAG TPA: CBS domain-containing protein [Tepidisphaeraceae bacterium]|jgi:CBS domain-containing protein
MARQRKGNSGKSTTPAGYGRAPNPAFEQPAPPEATNHDHAAPPGTRAVVPGAGVVNPTDDAGPMETEPDHGQRRPFPGHGTGPLNAPNALRPGTTWSGVASPPDPATSTSNTVVTEEATAGGGAPLSVPSDSVGPQPAAPGVREIADPNYTAAVWEHAHNRNHAIHREIGPYTHVRDIMSADPAYCEPDTLVQYVARNMAERCVGAIPVIENVDTMKPVGIITDRDIAIRVVAKNQDADGLRADQCMTADPVTIDDNAPAVEAAMRMRQHHVRRLPVVDRNGRLVGIVSSADLAQRAQ